MSNLKKIIVSLPESLLEQADFVLKEDKKNRSELIREALVLYLAERRKIKIRKDMERGYQEMGMLNASLAEEGMEADMTDLMRYETELMKSSR